MLYLEDYLEMIEHLPQELRDRFTEMREMDLSVQNNLDSLEKRVRIFFSQCRRCELPGNQADDEFVNIRKDYYKVLVDTDEKVDRASQMYDLVERYLRRLDSELYKFKCELEADNNGITEILEKRSLELDGNSNSSTNLNSLLHSSSNSQKENRYFGAIASSGAGNSIMSNHSGHRESSNNRYNRPKAEKRRNSNNGPIVSGQPPEKRQMIHHHSSGLSSSLSSNPSGNLNTFGLPVSNIRAIAPTNVVVSHGHMSHLHSHSGSTISQQLPMVVQQTNSSHLSSGVVTNQLVSGGGHSFSSANSLNLGSAAFPAENELMKAASEAITMTQQMPQGRRTASLKASVEAATGGTSGFSSQELLGRELAGAIQAVEREGNSSFNSSSQRRHKKKLSSLSSASSSMSSMPSSSLQLPTLESSSISMNDGGLMVEQTTDEWTFDPNEPRYCICNQVSYGDMVACDNEVCPFEWFHYPCVGITQSPKGKWYCPQCTSSMKRRGSRKT